MIIALTIIMVLTTIWSICSSLIIVNSSTGDLTIDWKCDNWYEKVAKLFWWIVLTLILIFVLIAISYEISKSIVCSIKNNDYKGCPVEKVK